MLDIRFIRENPELVKEGARKKNITVDIDRLLAIDEQRLALGRTIEEKRAEQNRESGRIVNSTGDERQERIVGMQHLKAGLAEQEAQFEALTDEWTKLMLAIPNLPSPDTPEGKDEDENQVVRTFGEPRAYAFTPKAHWDLGKELGILNTEKAAEVSGARFVYLMGDLVLLQFALIAHALKTLTSREALEAIAEGANLSVTPKPFVPVIPPVFMRSDVMGRMARLHPIEERYFFEKDDLVLVGSAEHTLGPLHLNEILEESELPIRYVGYSTAFRREAGSAGKDTRGMIRVHQFDKIEMETFVLPEDGYREQDFLLAIQESLMKSLGLHFQTIAVCTGDMSKPDQRQYDLNTWMPGQGTYRETHSADYMGGYQARRLNTRVRDRSGSIVHVHMNDATVFAIGRTLVAILEQYQEADGSVRVPPVLVPYVGKEVIRRST